MQLELSDKMISEIRHADDTAQHKQGIVEEGGGPMHENWDLSWDTWDEAEEICADLLHKIRLMIEEDKKT